MNKKEKDIIAGLLLSDAHLRKPGDKRRVSMSFTLKYADFASGIKKRVCSIPWGKDYVYKYRDKRTGNTYTQNRITTRVSDYLTSIYDLWYKNKKKIVPDIELTSAVLLWWYLGDGCLLKKKSRPKFRRIALATQSFAPKEVKRLIVQIKELLNSEYVYPENGGIIISREGICSFADIIGTVSPVECYSYKFDFGQYLDSNYKAQGYKIRPLARINEFRKKHKVRELEYVNKNTILLKENNNGY